MSVIPGWRLLYALSNPDAVDSPASQLGEPCQPGFHRGQIGEHREHRPGRGAIDGKLRADPDAETEIRRALDLREHEDPTGRQYAEIAGLLHIIHERPHRRQSGRLETAQRLLSVSEFENLNGQALET